VCRLAALFEFRAIIGRDTVDYDDADIEALYGHWNLVLQDVFLGFEVVDVSALNASQRWLLIWWQIRQFWVALKDLIQSCSLKLGFSRDIKSCAWCSILFL
jgi:hypothetical protein